MRDRRSKIYRMDDTLRLMFAFYSCISNNPNWILESEFSKQNRKIAKEIYPEVDLADYYFTVNQYFYGFTVEKVDEETIDCTIEEYETFYDFASTHLSMEFSYHTPSKSIVTLKSVEKITDKMEKQYRKIA